VCSCCSNVLYNPDLLKEKVTALVTSPLRNVEAQLLSREVIVTPAPIPFYRTTKGVIIIAMVSVVIIAAVVGGAVGGTKKHKNSVVLATTSDAFTSYGPTQEGGSPTSTGSNSHATALSTLVSTLTIIVTSQPFPTLTQTELTQR